MSFHSRRVGESTQDQQAAEEKEELFQRVSPCLGQHSRFRLQAHFAFRAHDTGDVDIQRRLGRAHQPPWLDHAEHGRRDERAGAVDRVHDVQPRHFFSMARANPHPH